MSLHDLCLICITSKWPPSMEFEVTFLYKIHTFREINSSKFLETWLRRHRNMGYIWAAWLESNLHKFKMAATFHMQGQMSLRLFIRVLMSTMELDKNMAQWKWGIHTYIWPSEWLFNLHNPKWPPFSQFDIQYPYSVSFLVEYHGWIDPANMENIFTKL